MDLDPTRSKAELITDLLALAEANGQIISVSRAGRLAAKIQRGDYSPELARVTGWADPTGEAATGFRQQPIDQLWTPRAA